MEEIGQFKEVKFNRFREKQKPSEVRNPSKKQLMFHFMEEQVPVKVIFQNIT